MQALDKEAERLLIIAAQAGDPDARTAIVKAHERALWKIAIGTKSRGETREDLFQIAVSFFLEGLVKFETSRGLRLSTYTHHFVRTRLYGHALMSGIIRLPLSAKATDPIAVDRAMRHTSEFVADKSEATQHDDGQQLVDDADEFARVKAAVELLPLRLRAYVRLLLDGHEPKEIAAQWGLTKQRINQLQHDAINLLRWHLGVSREALTDAARYGTMRRRRKKHLRKVA